MILSEKKIGTDGFVKLVGIFGDDNDICDAARLSYSGGTKKVSGNRDLIRYLVRHRHTSPLEQAEVKFHIRLPIFVMRQLIRHRTANVNEMSGRYSILEDEFYIPETFKYQSGTNKQGSGADHENSEKYKEYFGDVQKIASTRYHDMISDDVSRELARLVLPVNVYTECVWKCDLHNFFHFLKLRTDSHAQQEMQDFANAMEAMVRPIFPLSFGAYDDYIKNSVTLSAMEMRVLTDKLQGNFVDERDVYGMSDREWKEFHTRFPDVRGV